MKKKYVLIPTNKEEFLYDNLYMAVAIKDFGDVKRGDFGGYVESEENLSQEGNCWIYNRAKVTGNARVSENARVCGSASVLDNAKVSGNAYVGGFSEISDNAEISGNVIIDSSVIVGGYARVTDDYKLTGSLKIGGRVVLCGKGELKGELIDHKQIAIVEENKNCMNEITFE